MRSFLLLFIYSGIFISCNSVSSSQKSVTDSSETAHIISPKKSNNPIPITETATIIDYYRLMVNIGTIDREYSFKETKNGWICFNDGDEEQTYSCTVDINNGYLSVEDEGTGGGTGIMELTMYKTDDGRILFAYNTYSRGAAMYYVVVEDVQLHFFEYTQNTFKEITEKVLKEKVTPELFLDAAYKNNESLTLYYQLSGKEGSIRVSYDDNFCSFCKNLDENRERMQIEDESYEDLMERCNVCQHIVRKEISLVFDKQKGFFTIEKR